MYPELPLDFETSRTVTRLVYADVFSI